MIKLFQGFQFTVIYGLSVQYYPDVAMLLGSDIRKETGHDYFFCLTIAARNNVLNPAKRKKATLDLKKQQEQIWNELASRAPRKWRGYGSELEVDEEIVKDTRPLVSIFTEFLNSNVWFN